MQHQQQQQPSHHMPTAPSPLMFSSGSATTSGVNIPGQSNSTSRLHFTPFCLPTIDTQSSTNGQLSSSPSAIFHPANECSSSAHTTALLFANQQQQSASPSLYTRYTNGE